MGLRCLLGHDFTEPRTERDREERGDEVIISIREVKECRRCGEQQVVSENKEVTSMEGLLAESESSDPDTRTIEGSEREADPELDLDLNQSSDDTASEPSLDEKPETTPASHPDSEVSSSDGVTPDAATDDRVGADDPATDQSDGSDSQESPGAGVADAIEDAESDEGFSHPAADPDQTDSEADDAEILVDEPGVDMDDGDADRTAWDEESAADPADLIENASAEEEDPETTDPETDDGILIDEEPEPEDEAAAAARSGVPEDTDKVDDWPEQEEPDQGYEARPGDDDTVDLNGDLTPDIDPSDVEGPASADAEYVDPDIPDTASNGAPGGTDTSSGDPDSTDAGFTRAERRSVELSTTVPEPEAEYYCPECGLTEPVGESSMRAGDICPDCKRGYVSERDTQ